MNKLIIYSSILCVSFVQILNAQVQTRPLPKSGFEQRIHEAVYAIRLIDTHEHLMSEKDALASATDFSCLFTNYQLEDLISSGVAPETIYNTFKGKDASYPYGGEMATLAKNFPNVYIDMAWSALISPSYTMQYLQEFIETVPANKIMAFGGDSQTVEGAYGASILARETVEETLTRMVKNGYLTEEEALDIAKKILRENAISIYKLKF
ncbi:MAG: hypothetical protein WC865_02335 [Bacteroidales bacterium]